MSDSPLIDIRDLRVSIEDNPILKGLNLQVDENSVYVLFGPNGSGKTTLMKSLVGLPGMHVEGAIHFNGEDITDMSIDERANKGLNISFQEPPSIKGVTLRNMINICMKRDAQEQLDSATMDLVRRFKLEEFLERSVNVGFSGGERKRADILQLILQRPKLMLLDEPDSGVDVDSLKVMSREIARYLRETQAAAIIITHQGQVLDYITSKAACVMLNGKIHCYQDPVKILSEIKEKGYEECINCKIRENEGQG